MKTACRIALLGMVVLWSADAGASCPTPLLIEHSFSHFDHCPDFTPISALAYQMDDPTGADSGTVDIACEQTSCWRPPADAGAIGDGAVVIGFDWVFPETTGCPGTALGGPQHRVVIVVQASDGTGVIASLGRGLSYQDYLTVDSAHPLRNQFEVDPLLCSSAAGKPTVLSSVESPPGTVTLGLHFQAPLVHSDCDPGTRGKELMGTCNDNFQANPQVGRIYTSIQGCTGRTDLRRAVRWTLSGTQPDANGDATLTLLRPGVVGGGGTQCLYVGSTSIIGGYESGAITGFVRIPGTGCADADQDGWSTCEGDCVDNDATAHPGAPEVCNLRDDDCDGQVDEGTITCGIGACVRTMDHCAGGLEQPCVPGQPTPEVCNQIDDDCDGIVDAVDGDGDGFAFCSDCNDADPAVHPGAVEICNGRDDDCNGQLDNDAAGEDSDGDRIHNACDNCPAVLNFEQSDFDADGEGDACDLNDGILMVLPKSPSVIAWQREFGYSSYNLYRGDIQTLRQTGVFTQNPAVVPLAARVCDQTGNLYGDLANPSLGQVLFYLVTGNCDGAEGSLGTDSSGAERPNVFPCPVTDTTPCRTCDKPFQRIYHAFYNEASEGYRVIDNQLDWTAFCQESGVSVCSAPVDFSSEVALVAVRGTAHTTCDDVQFACVEEAGSASGLHAVVENLVPPAGCSCTPQVRRPLDVVKVARPVGTVTFEAVTRQVPCP